MHIKDLYGNDANVFSDTMAAYGLIQHVTNSTHKMGNILDLVFSEIDDSMKVGKTNIGVSLSDHRMVHTTLSIKKPAVKRESVMVRKISAITSQALCQEFNADISFDESNLDILIDKLDTEMRRTMDELAPLKEITISSHKNQPWYDSTVKERHKVVRNRERAWLVCKQESNWKAFTMERNIYNRLLRFKKRQVISKKVDDI